ncbi:MAG: hypothetical protein V4467_03430 [Patescibacteria group bacterium]
MNPEQPENLGKVSKSAMFHSQEDFQKDEAMRESAYRKMEKYATDLGCQFSSYNGSRYIEFKTWQEALDFQEFCDTEFGFKVKVNDPAKTDGRFLKPGYKVFPVFES